MTEAEIEELSSSLKMKKGHSLKLKKRLAKEQVAAVSAGRAVQPPPPLRLDATW